MAVKTTLDMRRKFFEMHLHGMSYQSIGDMYGLSRECVRGWCRRQRDGKGLQSHTQGAAKHAGPLQRFDPMMSTCILCLRRANCHWGPSRILFKLKECPPMKGKRLPSEATIGRYLHQFPEFRRKSKKEPLKHAVLVQPTAVHECWAMDFKMGIRLGDDSQVNLHSVRDVFGAVSVMERATPAGKAGRKPPRVSVAEARETLRAAFTQWQTLPQRVRTDNEAIFVGKTGDPFPGAFTLYLVGLGIGHETIRPGKPTQNAEVERSHRTICDYVGDIPTLTELQSTLQIALHELAFDLPSRAHGCEGQPPVIAHPDLLQPSDRPYRPEYELALFDLQRVDTYLATLTWQRTVGNNGQVCIGGYHHYYLVGRAYAGQDVLVRFDPADRHFVFYQTQLPEHEIGRRPARGLDMESLTGLTPESPNYVPQQLLLFRLPQGVYC